MEQSTDGWKLQLSLDRVITMNDDGGHLMASLAVDYVSADSSVRSMYGGGGISTRGYGVGTMWTWYGHTGAYVDAQVQINRYTSELRSSVLGRLARDNDGRGEAVSIELGKELGLDANWSVTPQAQFSYSGVRFNRFVDLVDSVVSSADAASLVSRAGIAINRNHAQPNRHSHLHVIANFSHEWEDGLHTRVSGVELSRMHPRQTGELGFGASATWHNGVRLYGEVLGKAPLRDIKHSYTVQGAVGIGMKF